MRTCASASLRACADEEFVEVYEWKKPLSTWEHTVTLLLAALHHVVA